MNAFDLNHSLREQWEFHWNHQLRARLEGLSDDEYFWSPVPDAWSVRPRGTSTAQIQAGSGDFTIDFAFPRTRAGAVHHDRVAARARHRRGARGP